MEQLHHLGYLRIKGEKEFREVFEHFHGQLCFFAASLLTIDLHAEDVVQEAFVKLWERKEDFDNIRAIKSFLYLTVRNQCFNINKHQKVVDRYQRLAGREEDLTLDEKQYMLEAQVLENVFEALQKLPRGYRTVMHFSYFEGLQNKDIAARMKVSVNTVKTQKKRALQILRTSIHTISCWCLSWVGNNSF